MLVLVFKQGYLFTSSGFFGRRKRKWYRTYTTKLYVVEAVPDAPSCSMDVVCDITNATIAAKHGNSPFKFVITLVDGKKIELQVYT